MQVFCLKSHCCLSGSAELCGVINIDFRCILMLKRGVRTSGEIYNSECISTTVKHGERGVMVWGAFSDAGTGELLHCEKSINALEYRRKLKKGLLPTIEKLFYEEMLSFNKIMLLPTTKKSITLMFWPSPNLNPIENI